MATYKIPQNVEAEDKLIGPFTFKQFIFLVVASVAIGLGFLLFRIQPLLVLIPLPIVLVFGILGLYHREDQPVETYLVAALNYYFRRRRRLWDSSDIVQSVKITAPKKIARPKTKLLGATEHTQLERLARIVDTHGWAVKRPELTEPMPHQPGLDTDDRLAVQTNINQVEPLDVHASDDILDVYNNPEAKDFNDLAKSSQQAARSQAIAKMKSAQASRRPDYLKPASAASSFGAAGPAYNPYPNMQQKVIAAPEKLQQLSQNNSMSVSQLSSHAKQAEPPAVK